MTTDGQWSLEVFQYFSVSKGYQYALGPLGVPICSSSFLQPIAGRPEYGLLKFQIKYYPWRNTHALGISFCCYMHGRNSKMHHGGENPVKKRENAKCRHGEMCKSQWLQVTPRTGTLNNLPIMILSGLTHTRNLNVVSTMIKNIF